MEKTHCKYCLEEIQAEAKKCPHCQGWQTKFDPQNPKVGLYLSLVIIALIPILLAPLLFEIYSDDPKDDVDTSLKSLEVISSSLKTFECEGTKCLAIVGIIENTSDQVWNNVFFHVDFYDSNDQLIDTFSDRDSDIVIPARSKTTFRVVRIATNERSAYSSHKVSIRWAKTLE